MRVATVPYCHRAHFLQNILRFTRAERYCCSHSSSYSCILDKIYRQVILCLTLIWHFFWRCFESFRGICLLFFFSPSSFVGVKAGKTDVQWTWKLAGSHGEDDSVTSTCFWDRSEMLCPVPWGIIPCFISTFCTGMGNWSQLKCFAS